MSSFHQREPDSGDGELLSSNDDHQHYVSQELKSAALAEKIIIEDDEYPEGGLKAWLTVLGAWLVQFCTYGSYNAFGVYQDFYVREFLTNQSASNISWIGSVQLMITMSIGLVTGAMYDKGYFHHLMIGGSFLFCFSLFMLSLAKEDQFYQIFLSQAVGLGLGMGITYIPSIGVVSHYFKRKRAFAMGVCTFGSAVGGIVHPIMLNNLFNSKVGFHDGVRISAALQTVLLILANLLLRPRLPPASQNGTVTNGRWEAVKRFSRDGVYVFTIIGTFFTACGMFFPLFYIQLIAIQHGIDPTLAFYALTTLNAASALGRLVPNFLADRFGVFNSIILGSVATAAACYGTVGVHNGAGVIMFAIMYGFASGAYIALVAPTVASTATSVNEIGQRFGIGFILGGLGGLIGAPIAGALLTAHYRWWKPTIFSGTLVVTGSCMFAIARFIFSRRRGTSYV